MEKRFYIFLYVTVISLSVSSSGYTSPRQMAIMEEAYQHDMDIVRLNDLKTLGQLIEEYHEKKGHYPFEKRYEYALYVHITTKGQRKYAKQRPPYTHVLLDVKEFIAEIESGIERHIDLPFDPQKVPVFKPNFYIYKIYNGEYYLAVHLYGEFSFAREIGPHYQKVEISNYSKPSKAIWKLKDLLQNKDFIKAAGEKLLMPGYVKEMRGKIYKEGAF